MSFLIASGHIEVEAKTDSAKSKITALIGAVGALGPAAAVAGAAVAAAGVGVAAFGAAAGKQVADLKKASQAQGKYQEAVDKSGKRSQEAVKAELAYQQTLAKMPKATREATAAFSALSDSYKDWSDNLAGDTMPVFTKTFQVFSALLPKTTGLVKGTSVELNRLITLIAGGVASPGFDKFMASLTEFSRSTLHSLTNGLMDLSRSFGGFTAGGGFDSFIDTAKQVGPLAGETLANLAKAMLNLVSAGGEMGISMLSVANALAKLVNAIPPEVLSTLLQLYAAFKLIKIGAAGFLALQAGMVAFTASIRAMGVAAIGASGGLATLRVMFATLSTGAKATVIGAAIGVLVIGLMKLSNIGKSAPPDVDRLTTSLGKLGETGKVTGEAARAFGPDLSALGDSLRTLARPSNLDKTQQFLTSLIGMDSTPVKDAKTDFNALDDSLTNLVRGGKSDLAAAALKQITTNLKAQGYTSGEVRSQLDDYKGALEGAAFEQQVAARGMGLFGQQALATRDKLDAQKASTDGLASSINALSNAVLMARGGIRGMEAALDAADEAFKKNGRTLDETTAKGRGNNQALDDIASSTMKAAESARANGASWSTVNGIYDRGYDKILRLTTGVTGNEAAARKLADQILRTPDKTARLKGNLEDLESKLATAKSKLGKVPDSRKASIRADIADLQRKIAAAQAKLDGFNGRSATAYIDVQTRYTNPTPGPYAGKYVFANGGLLRGYASGGSVQAFPGGGMISGPGTSTSDSILGMFANGPARVSDSEYVVRAAAVRKYGVGVLNALNAGRLRLPGFAKGGKLSEKQKEAIRKQNEARGQLRGDVTLGNMSVRAGRSNPEIRGNLAKGSASESDLINNLYALQSKIKGSFSGKTESKLLSQLNKSASSLFKLRDSSEKNSKALDAAKDKLNSLKDSFTQLKDSVKSSLIGFANITKIGKYGTSADTLIKQLSSDVGRTTEFSKQLEQLKAKGLNAQSISEIAAAGVTGGGMSTAQSLLAATPDQIAQINALEKQLATSADKAGKTTADAMYGAGIKAADGLVKGLTAKQKAIEDQMMAIAKSMEKAIKKALGIKSPSRVMEPIGDYAMQGIEVGWTKRLAKGKTLISGGPANAVKPSFVQPSTPGAAAMGGMTIQTLTVNVNGSFDFASPAERRTAAKALVKDINEELRLYQKQRAVSR
ncbi:hypothetical protein ACWEAF_05675 [Streptomyces sp. NPDC005071]